MSHIKTPWRVKEFTEQDAARGKEGWEIQHRFNEEWETIIHVYPCLAEDGTTHMEDVHAPLVAAAPDLLAALKNLAEKSDLILSEINSFDSGWYYQFQAAVQQARNALAKATGDHQATNHKEG